MVNKFKLIFIITIITSLPIGCNIVGSSDKEGSTNKNPPISEQNPIKEQIGKMSLDEKIGQMMIVGFDGYTADEGIKEIIEKYHPGGVILFKRNIKDGNQLLSLLNELKSINSSNEIPLFLSIDEEGGKVSRLPDEFDKIPSSETIGQVNNEDLSYNIGKILGRKLKALGFNMDFAPVLDINSNSENPIIGDRAFGDNAEIVTKLGIETMRGIQSEKVISVVKHFPGHGDTSEDSHIGLPRVDNDLSRLESLELIPFKEAINNGVDAVMIAHILMSEIDPEKPASMSRTIISDILRNRLNFNKIIITDDMTMGAILDNYNIGDAAVQSINAGIDIVLVCHGYDNEITVIKAVKEAVKNDIISEERIDESVYRILSLKEKYNINDNIIDSINTRSINDSIRSLLEKYISPF